MRKLLKEGRYSPVKLELESTFNSITDELRFIEKAFRRLERLEKIEEDMVGKKDKLAGRNRLSLGKEYI